MQHTCSLIAVVALTATPLAVHAQDADTVRAVQPRVRVEALVAQYSVQTDAVPDRTGVGGYGGRVMFGKGSVAGALRSVVSRARAGGFVVYTAEQKADGIRSTHIGGQIDLPFFANPIFRNVLDPFFSLGAGGFRTSAKAVDGLTAGAGRRIASTDFALTPGIGTVIPLVGGLLNVRGDLRDLIVFGNTTTNNVVAEGGLMIAF